MTTPATAHQPDAAPDDPQRPGLPGRMSAEAVGTFFVVVAGLGVPLFTIPQSNPLSASLAAGLAVTAAMLAFGYVSGGHFNPAVTAGHAVAGRIRPADAAAYVGAQLAGAVLGAVTLFAILRTVPNIADTRTAFDTVAAGFGENSVIQVPLVGVFLIEVLGAALLVAVFLGTTADRNPSRLAAPFAVGLTMAVLLQFGQAPGNTPFNPARATASALFSSPDVLGQLWLFWVPRWWVRPLRDSCSAAFAQSTRAGAATGVETGAAEAAGDDETDDEDASPAAAGGEPESDAGMPTAPSPFPAEVKTADDEARDFFDKRGK